MKKLKIIFIVMVMVFSLALFNNIEAEEITTDPVTTEEEYTLPELTTNYEEIESWIVGGLISIIGGGALSLVGYVVLNSLKKKAMNEIIKAVNSNQLSQAQADKATKIINDGVVLIQEKMDKFDKIASEKMDKILVENAELKNKVDKMDKFLDNFGGAIETFINDDEV